MADPLWSEESTYKKILNRWNRKKRDYIDVGEGKREYGMNANGFEKYPQMLYKAMQNPLSGKFEVVLYRDVISVDKTTVILSAEQFNASCQMVVNSDEEYERAKNEGWRDTQKDAMAFHESLEKAVSDAAAYRAYEDRNMSEKARAEIKALEEKTEKHLAEIPEQPRKPMSEERKAKLRESLAKAREAKAAKKQTAN